jgi:hypothetical protein
MKTTDLYLEQVLIGFLVILIAALPWIPQLWAHSGDVKTGISIIGGSAALGFAFFIGIPFDRLADTLSERLDIRHRLKFALDYLIKPEADRKDFPVGDPFPEDMLMILCRRDQSVTRAHDYLRSRLRLTRALAVYAPAMAFIATLSVARWETVGTKVDPSTAAIWFGIVAAAYLAWALIVSDKSDLPLTKKVVIDFKLRPPQAGRDVPTLIVPLLLLAASIIVGLAEICDHPLVLAAAVAGTVLSGLSAWSWWRISKTFRKFLSDWWKFSDHTGKPGSNPGPAASPPSGSPS